MRAIMFAVFIAVLISFDPNCNIIVLRRTIYRKNYIINCDNIMREIVICRYQFYNISLQN